MADKEPKRAGMTAMQLEFIEMARRCSAEIKSLRSQIAALTPKAEAYDAMTCILGLLPQRSRSMSEDLSWRLDKRIEELLAQKTE